MYCYLEKPQGLLTDSSLREKNVAVCDIHRDSEGLGLGVLDNSPDLPEPLYEYLSNKYVR